MKIACGIAWEEAHSMSATPPAGEKGRGIRARRTASEAWGRVEAT
jgi:hypothetical protein